MKTNDCGCGDRAVRLRDALKFTEDEFPEDYVRERHVTATGKMVARRLADILNITKE